MRMVAGEDAAMTWAFCLMFITTPATFVLVFNVLALAKKMARGEL